MVENQHRNLMCCMSVTGSIDSVVKITGDESQSSARSTTDSLGHVVGSRWWLRKFLAPRRRLAAETGGEPAHPSW